MDRGKIWGGGNIWRNRLEGERIVNETMLEILEKFLVLLLNFLSCCRIPTVSGTSSFHSTFDVFMPVSWCFLWYAILTQVVPLIWALVIAAEDILNYLFHVCFLIASLFCDSYNIKTNVIKLSTRFFLTPGSGITTVNYLVKNGIWWTQDISLSELLLNQLLRMLQNNPFKNS